jgi:hypothetical protein
MTASGRFIDALAPDRTPINDRSAGPDQAQRGIQRFRPADLDDQIDGIGEFTGTPRPIGLVAVIDDRVGAEFGELGELGGLRLAGRGDASR